MERKEFAPLSFWAWNEFMDDESICRRIEEFHEEGLRGFFMHSRAGLMTSYLSKEWFHACRTAVKKAEELGMEAWIYDEDGWPSGFAGGLVNGCGQEYQAKYIKICKADDETAGHRILASFRKTSHGYDFTEPAKADVLFVCVTEPNYVDLLSKKVTEKFLEVTHERYKEELGEFFGTVVPGFFTDEPQYDLHGFPYSDELEEYFRKRNGYSFLKSMYLFLETESPETGKFRKDYWDTVQEMMEFHFARQIYDWCEKNHVKFTGHFPGEDSFIQQMQSTAGVMPKYKYMQQPGIDHLGKRITSVLLTKQVTSAAKQYGRNKVLSETFGCAGWNITFEEMCYIWGWQAASGINIPVLHIGAHTMKGIRKRDYPAFYSYQEPWWEQFHHVAHWMEGIGYFMEKGEWTEDTLVLSPLKSIYLLHRERRSEAEQEYAASYRSLLENLMDIQVGYDIGDEEIIRDCGAVEDGKFIVGKCVYHTVIVPKCLILEENTVCLLKKFRSQGGTVLFTGELPKCGPADMTWAKDCHVIQNRRGFWDKCFAALHSKRDMVVFEKEGLHIAKDLCVSVKQAEKKYIYIWNRHQDSVRKLMLKISGQQKVCEINPETEARTFMEVQYSGGDSMVYFQMEGRQSILLEAVEGMSHYREPEEMYTCSLRGNWKLSGRNALTLDYAAFSFDDKIYSEEMPMVKMHPELYRRAAEEKADKFYIRYSFHNEMEHPVTLQAAVEDDDCIGVWCNGTEITSSRADWYMDEKIHEYSLEGKLKEGWNTVKAAYRIPSEEVRDVEGLFETEVNRFFYPVEPEAIYILGDFWVQPQALPVQKPAYIQVKRCTFSLRDRKEISGFQNVTTQGCWFYRGNLKTVLEIDKMEECIQYLKFSDLRAAAVLIRCNGHSELLYMSPFRVKLTPMLREGKNHVEVILYGTNRNLLGPHHHCKGEVCFVGPNTFKGIRGYEDHVVSPDIDFEDTWTDSYSFQPFGVGKIILEQKKAVRSEGC